MKKLLIQFRKQPAPIKLFITFSTWFIVWFVVELFFYVPNFANEQPTLKATITKSIFFSIVFTLSFDWKLVKQCFQKNGINDNH